MSVWSWLASALLVAAAWGVGDRKRAAFLLTVVGEAVWVVIAVDRGMYDLAAVCVVFGVVAVRNYRRWGHG
jgi:hypothetical protein